MLNSAIVLAAGEGHHVVNELPIPAPWYGIIVFVSLMFMLLCIMGMRSVGIRPSEPGDEVVPHGHEAQGHGSHQAQGHGR
ncbi:hypothetical protein M3C74_07860 [Micrococcus lylae]|uniref:hypothetical protein n=1 Tax=Micrococcus TaxID=1269 RepID=UPI0008A45E89|nr:MULTISPECIES: hypothetical protein [Micrococcus]MCT2007789.1 hypothetical protein [Micrococcus lylae]MCT2071741.1 hypothetical protein [Micrococcus lylae]OFR90510.1 hypothetical protein HMPREF2863_06805 [Micrococcus sp. HMSC067E09]WIK82769.1 hypothetical protein CJ228_002870 [Micrococcus lylae]